MTGHWYDVEVEVSGITATLKVGGQAKVSCGFTSGIVGGKVGLRVGGAHSHFKEVALKAFVQVTSYYVFNGMRVALRKDNQILRYLAGDHLGTTSVVLDAEGSKVAESRHRPYGEVRWPAEDGDFPTDHRFTGQRLEAQSASVGAALQHSESTTGDKARMEVIKTANDCGLGGRLGVYWADLSME